MNTAAFPIQVFFSGEAEAHGLRNRDPETGPILAACIGQEWDEKNKCAFLSLKVKESNHPNDKDLVFRIRVAVPQQGLKDGEIKAREAELKALKISVLPADKQTNENIAKINAAKGDAKYNFDFAGKDLRLWFEPGNPNAPAKDEKLSQQPPAYNQGFNFIRWIDAATYGEVKSGARQVGLRNSPLKGGSAASDTSKPSGIAGMAGPGTGLPAGMVLPAGMGGPTTAQPPNNGAGSAPATDSAGDGASDLI
jgi:hypothetical protein